MSDRDDGGQAFPFQPHGGHVRTGMSLRDYFAAQAMQGICAHQDTWGYSKFSEMTEKCYEIADAMLAARKEPK